MYIIGILCTRGNMIHCNLIFDLILFCIIQIDKYIHNHYLTI